MMGECTGVCVDLMVNIHVYGWYSEYKLWMHNRVSTVSGDSESCYIIVNLLIQHFITRH